MGTNLQEVFDAFFIKIPEVNFTNKESQVFQFFKTSLSKCKKKVYDNLNYIYDTVTNIGNFEDVIDNSTVELLATYMVKEYFSQQFSIISGRKAYLGTQAFNKIPSNKELFEIAESQMNYWDREISKLQSDFPDYSDER